MENSEDPHTFGETIDNGGNSGTHSTTCTFDGCGYKQTKAHNFDANGNCTECDAIQNKGCQHDYSIVSNDDTKHWTGCSKCGAIQEQSKEEHELGKYENNYDGTHSTKCTFTGCEYEAVFMHEFDENGKCKVCDAIACDEGEHNFSEFKWDNEIHYLSCKWCDDAKLDSMERHTLGKWTTNVDGKQQAKCTNENCEYVETRENEGLLGDLNLDGEINVTDLIILKRHVIAGSKAEWILTGDALTLADLNSDDNVDITDIIKLKRTILESL